MSTTLHNDLGFDYVLVEDQNAFDDLIAQFSQSDIISLDTEFVRTRTYYAKLGLVQMYDGQTLALVDPLKCEDLSGLWQLLANENIIKLLHAGSEDLDIFAHYGQVEPKSIFDTQFAASICGFDHGLGYARLVEQCLGVVLDKGESRTDWMKRPLSQKQLDYAANDVFYLYSIFPILKQKLVELDRYEWVFEEGQIQTAGRTNEHDFDNAYLKVKNAFQLTPKQLALLKPLASWRLNTAVKKDTAIGFILKDHILIALAKAWPKSLKDFSKIREMSNIERGRYGKQVLSCFQQADFDNLPERIDAIAYRDDYKGSFKLVKKHLTQVAEQNTLPLEQIASKKMVHEYLGWLWKQPDRLPKILTSWRGRLTEESLSKLEV
ncbi:ribonuclease D [Parashewanella curva]|uniref:Ribonuclease D n=1 Tax=Parashewanella curva TaxID=2338552 RepID=A0A3L8Q0Z7_9GAMM|nr:ribonuclease D [Parashewanella curva]RLV61255.1 ribonuclease D [Parashewanella curva]